jgi:PAS domain S-box-containing protein
MGAEPDPTPIRVLVVEDAEDDVALLARALRRGGYAPVIERVETPEAMSAALDRGGWDLVVADHALPQFGALEALALLKARGLDLPFLIVSGTIREETAVAAMKAGAHDYVMKGHLERLVPAIQRELRDAAERQGRASAESALARERDYSHLLVEMTNAMIVSLDADGRVTLFNRAAEAITGFRRVDVVGRSWFETVAPRERCPESWEWFRTAADGETAPDREMAIVTAAGEARIVMWRDTVLRSGAAFAGVISFGIDVTEQKRAEQRRAAIEQLARRSERLAAVGSLAAGLAHELNNPIGIISSRIELMLLDDDDARALPPGVRDDLEVLHRQAERVTRITRGLLSFARQSPAERSPVDLNRVIEEVLLLTRPQIAKTGVRIETLLEPGLPAISGDGAMLQQVMLNLITNAWQAHDGAGEIRIVTRARREAPPAVEVAVEDTGRGIHAADLERIFDPFFTTKSTGTGLGLSITHSIVHEHGGTIDVDSTPGQGTRFVLTFPG